MILKGRKVEIRHGITLKIKYMSTLYPNNYNKNYMNHTSMLLIAYEFNLDVWISGGRVVAGTPQKKTGQTQKTKYSCSLYM